jgi:hypothetical protein
MRIAWSNERLKATEGRACFQAVVYLGVVRRSPALGASALALADEGPPALCQAETSLWPFAA